MAFFDAFVQATTEWPLLLYFNHIGFTTPSDDTFFVRIFALSFLVPVLVNIPLSHLAARIGVRRTLACSYFISSIGMIFLVFSRLSPALYVIGHISYSIFWSLRIIRLSAIASLVAPTYRTTAIALHQFLIPVGCLAGPAIWLIVQRWRGYIEIFGLQFDRFSINFVMNCISNMSMAILAYCALPTLTTPYLESSSERKKSTDSQTPFEQNLVSAESSSYGAIPPEDVESQTTPDGRQLQFTPAVRWFVRSRLILFCTLAFIVRGCAGIFQVVFQPAMLDYFHTDDAELGRIFLIIAAVALIPPLAVTVMTTFMTDPQILLFGICLKILGMALYLPLFGTISKLQIIIAYAVTVKATIFFTTVSVSVFSKVIGPYYNHSYVGYLWTCAMLGPAMAQGVFSGLIVPLYGSWSFGLFGLPTVFAMIAILTPTFWPCLDPKEQYIPQGSKPGVVASR